MKQFENYLSRGVCSGAKSAIIFPQTEEFLEILSLLEKYTDMEKIYCVLPARTTLTNKDSMLYSYNVEIGNISDFKKREILVDMVLFDYNRSEDVKNLINHRGQSFIGRMNTIEDYFSFWEKYEGTPEGSGRREKYG